MVQPSARPSHAPPKSLTKVLRKSYGSLTEVFPQTALAQRPYEEALRGGLTQRPYAKPTKNFLDKSLTRRPCGSVAQRSCAEAIREVSFQWRMLREARSYAEVSRMGLTRKNF